jgi:hypothetical protein
MILAEDIVQEWLIQKRYFTVKNLKSKSNKELDLLGVKFEKNGKITLIHVEVSVNYNPIGWFSSLEGRVTGNRTVEESKSAVCSWVKRKFKGDNAEVRNKFSPHAKVSDWEMLFVHGILNNNNKIELEYMGKLGIKIKSIKEIMDDLQMSDYNLRTGGIGKNISDLITVYKKLE